MDSRDFGEIGKRATSSDRVRNRGFEGSGKAEMPEARNPPEAGQEVSEWQTSQKIIGGWDALISGYG